tara:strand:+ start:237 stop:710 length:474 start_codon:yes stop_codon:yes gene_type:complete
MSISAVNTDHTSSGSTYNTPLSALANPPLRDLEIAIAATTPVAASSLNRTKKKSSHSFTEAKRSKSGNLCDDEDESDQHSKGRGPRRTSRVASDADATLSSIPRSSSATNDLNSLKNGRKRGMSMNVLTEDEKEKSPSGSNILLPKGKVPSKRGSGR